MVGNDTIGTQRECFLDLGRIIECPDVHRNVIAMRVLDEPLGQERSIPEAAWNLQRHRVARGRLIGSRGAQHGEDVGRAGADRGFGRAIYERSAQVRHDRVVASRHERQRWIGASRDEFERPRDQRRGGGFELEIEARVGKGVERFCETGDPDPFAAPGVGGSGIE